MEYRVDGGRIENDYRPKSRAEGVAANMTPSRKTAAGLGVSTFLDPLFSPTTSRAVTQRGEICWRSGAGEHQLNFSSAYGTKAVYYLSHADLLYTSPSASMNDLSHHHQYRTSSDLTATYTKRFAGIDSDLT